MWLASASTTSSLVTALVGLAMAGALVAAVIGTVLALRGRRELGALVLGLASLGGLVLPLLIFAGLAAAVIGWKAVRASRAAAMAWAGLILGAAGTLLSLVFPAIVVYLWIYAATHGSRLP